MLEVVPDSKLDTIHGIVNITICSFEENVLDDEHTRSGGILNLENPYTLLNVTGVGISIDVTVVREQVQGILDIEEHL